MTAAPPRHIQNLRGLAAAAGRFGVVGLLCAALNVGVVYLGHNVLGVHYLIAACATCFVTIPLGYLLHGRFSFGTGRPVAIKEFSRFVVVQLGQFALGLVLLAGLVESTGLAPVWAMVAVSALLYVYAFAATSTWVFRMLPFKAKQPPT